MNSIVTVELRYCILLLLVAQGPLSVQNPVPVNTLAHIVVSTVFIQMQISRSVNRIMTVLYQVICF